MAFMMASLLMYDEQAPAGARALLRAASESTPAQRAALLESAASVLRELGLECSDARQLVDLDAGDCGGCPCM
jgi:hypothetical protein